MLYIIDRTTNPQWNLAAEEYLLKEFKEPIFRLWQNEDSIIVGRNQNTMAEIDIDYVKKNNIKVVRRLTGGGAVFHDLGNLNFTFIEAERKGEDSSAMFKRFTAPILQALTELGIEAELSGRNDLMIKGKKFSGNAICIYNGRILQHGTLLFSSSINSLSNALKIRPEKFQDKAVKSNRSRVTNISEHLGRHLTIEQFRDFLSEYICNSYMLPGGDKPVPYEYTDNDIKAIDKLCAEKYSTDKWNFNNSPKFSFSNIKKLNGGIVEIYFNVERGFIKNTKVFGDYFFTKPSEEFCRIIEGTGYTPEAISAKLASIETKNYFINITKDELISLFF